MDPRLSFETRELKHGKMCIPVVKFARVTVTFAPLSTLEKVMFIGGSDMFLIGKDRSS